METVLAGLAAIVIITFVVPLAVLRAGVWRQERAASLACRPRGLSAAIARRVFGLYAYLPDEAEDPAVGPGTRMTSRHWRPAGTDRAAHDREPRACARWPGQASAAAVSCHGLPARGLIAGLGGRAG